MEASKNKRFARLVNLVLPFFTPGHFSADLLLGICLGISITGILSIIFFTVLNSTVGRHAEVSYGGFRIALWFASNFYIAAILFIRKGLYASLLSSAKSNGADHKTVSKLSKAA